jgi:hypothetical protein
MMLSMHHPKLSDKCLVWLLFTPAPSQLHNRFEKKSEKITKNFKKFLSGTVENIK